MANQKTSVLDGARAVKAYLQQTCCLEEAAKNPFFEVARAMILESVFAKLPRLESLTETAKVPLGEA